LITCLKGRGAKRRYATRQFKAGWFAFEGQRHTYQLFEKKTRLRAAGWLRTVVFVGEDGQASQARALPAFALAAGSEPGRR